MKLGFAACTAGENEAQRFLKVPNLAIQCEYLQLLNHTWAAGLFDPAWTLRGAGAETLIMSVPLLVGPQTGTPPADAGSGQTLSPQAPTDLTGLTDTPTTMTLDDVAAGVWDDMFAKAIGIIAANRDPATTILRWGWEQYGNGWFAWNGLAMAAKYKAAYRHCVALSRAVSPNFRYEWNGNVAYAAWNPADGSNYVGDDVCDYMTCDVYDGFDPGGAAGWISYRDQVLTQALNFAKSHGKPFGFSEFGLFYPGFFNGYGDDPAWVKEAFYWLRQNQADIAFACFFQNFTGVPTGDGGGALQRNPQSAAIFQSLYSAWARDSAGLDAKRFVSSGVNRFRVKSH